MKHQLSNFQTKNREPIDYQIGRVEFLGCKIDLSQRPFIPRPETEFWVSKAIEDIKKEKKKKIFCLDIFAGSGCIGIAILKKIKNSQVDFREINKKFLKQIEINLKLNNIDSKRYRLIQSDIFQEITLPCPAFSGTGQAPQETLRPVPYDAGLGDPRGQGYDYIFANPPYIALKRKNLVQKSVLDFEPKKAIFAGSGGLFYIKKFLKEAKNYLPGGRIEPSATASRRRCKIYLEFDHFQKNEISKILEKFHYQDYQFFKDQFGKWRYVTILYSFRN